MKHLNIAFILALLLLATSVVFVDLVWNAVNSTSSSLIVGVFISAFAGTWGAQLLAERNARRRELLAEIRGTNVAIGVAFNIANTYIGVKKQHIRDLVAAYEQQCLERQRHLDSVVAGTIASDTRFTYQLELRVIPVPFSPVEELQAFLRDRISPDGKSVVLLAPLVQSARVLADTVRQRNSWIEEFKHLPPGDDATRAAYYFGTPFAQGRIDDRYPNFMKAIALQTDDCIGFSVSLTESLMRHGGQLAKEFSRGAPEIAAPDFARASDLLPDMAHYVDWSAS